MSKFFYYKNSVGFGLIEIIVAVGLFVIIAAGSVITILQSQTMNRLGQTETYADLYAQEGIEAVKSLKNRSFANISAGNYGLTNAGNVWNFTGTSDSRAGFTRQILIEAGRRSGGSIVDAGGIIDINLFKVTSKVSWGFSPTRNNLVEVVTYLTNFRKYIANYDGLLIYGDGTTTPKFRIYNSVANNFGGETAALTTAVGQTFTLRTSPTQGEAIAGFVTSSGVLHVLCHDGATWHEEWSANVGGNGSTKRFDIAYETHSGDSMVLYSSNLSSSNELAFRTKPGATGCGTSNWSGVANLNPVRTSGLIQWVKLAWDRRSDQTQIAALWVDANSDLSAAIWNGTSWVNEPSTSLETSLEVVSTAHDVEDFDLEYESVSGDLLVIWANSLGQNNVNGVRYSVCTGGVSNCTWSGVLTPPTFSDDATNLDISANPNTDEIVFASLGDDANDLQIGYWSGSAWTNTANADTSTNFGGAGSRSIATGWLLASGTARSVILYRDQGSSSIDWYVGDGGTFTKQTDVPVSPAPGTGGYMDIQMDPLNKNQLIYMTSDGANDLFAKRLVMTSAPLFNWTNSDGSVLENALPQSITSPFAFAFRRL